MKTSLTSILYQRHLVPRSPTVSFFSVRQSEALSPAQTDATLLDVTCCVRLHTLLHVVGSCCAEFDKLIKFLSQQFPTFLLFRDRRSVAQQRWIRLQSSSNIVGATYAHYKWFTKTYGLYLSHDALQVPTFYGQQCWELLRPFGRSLRQSVMWVYEVNI